MADLFSSWVVAEHQDRHSRRNSGRQRPGRHRGRARCTEANPIYDDFIKKYAGNNAAVAYAEWQLSQQYLSAGDTAKALEDGDKALELCPNDLDILVSQVSVAQAMKDNGKIVDYAVRGAKVFNSISTQPKPADVSDADWTARVTEEQESAQLEL